MAATECKPQTARSRPAPAGMTLLPMRECDRDGSEAQLKSDFRVVASRAFGSRARSAPDEGLQCKLTRRCFPLRAELRARAPHRGWASNAPAPAHGIDPLRSSIRTVISVPLGTERTAQSLLFKDCKRPGAIQGAIQDETP